jgi:thymidine phosphorylase
VDSQALITASILSKMPQVFGRYGPRRRDRQQSFMANLEAESARSPGVLPMAASVRGALIADMNEPLADAASNALQITNYLAFLRSEDRQPA